MKLGARSTGKGIFRPMAVRYVSAYILLGVLWIVFSDKVVHYLANDLTSMVDYQTAKGCVFVGITGLFLYFVAKSSSKVTEIGDRQEPAVQNEKAVPLVITAHTDHLTGLPNSQDLEEQVTQLIAQSRENEGRFAVLAIDIDRFHLLSNLASNRYGDLVIREVTQRLRGCLQARDLLARTIGDKFIAVLIEQNEEGLQRTASKMLQEVTAISHLEKQECYVTVSIGGCQYTKEVQDADTLFKQAENALNRSKKQGGNQYVFQSGFIKHTDGERMHMANALRKAIDRNELCLYYQPQYGVAEGEITGTEALLRWQHPERGMISPAEFIPVAEEMGLICEIGEWVLRTACRQNKAWQAMGIPPVKVAVNLSARQLQQDSIVHTVSQVLDDTGLEPCYLELEMTENISMFEDERIVDKLKDLKRLGVQLSLDDFGIGYSSLGYLNQFPIDKVKIDRSFIQKIGCNDERAPIVSAMIAMAKNLHLRVLAEGVETREQLHFLMDQRCDEVQGFLCSKPLPAEQLTELLLAKQNGKQTEGIIP